MILKELISTLDFFYPPKLAENWDNVGLLVGDENKKITRVLTALEVTPDVVDEAIERGCEVIVCHHPIIFKSLKNINYSNPSSQLLVKLINADIAVFCMHTNVDIAENGMNDWLSEILELTKLSVLSPTKVTHYKSIEIEVKPNNLSKLIDLLKTAGVGNIGSKLIDYNVSSINNCIELRDGTKKVNDIYLVKSFVKDEDVAALSNLLKLHKINIYRIHNIENMKTIAGIGKIGKIKPQSLEQLAYKIKNLFNLKCVNIVGSREDVITNVAIVGGSGSDYIKAAKDNNCDVLITGDVTFHKAQEALLEGICIIDAGHCVEIVFNDYMADFINILEDVVAFSSEIDTNPFEVV